MTSPPNTLVISDDDTLPHVLGRLRDTSDRTLILAIPDGSSLLLTASEFRALKDTVERRQLALTLGTDDPLRVQLAGMFGLPTNNAQVAITPDPMPRARVGTTPAPVSSVPRRRPLVSAAEPLVIESPRRRSISLRHLDGRGRILTALAIGLALLAIGAGIWALLPRATVTLELKRQPLSGEVRYQVVAPGSAAPVAEGVAFVITGEMLSEELTLEASIPTTGGRGEPDQTATGAVRFANPTAEEITLDQGTVLPTDSDITYTLTEEVTVPARDADEDRAGAAGGTVRADRPGTAGNIDQGMLSGQLESGVYFSNREGPIEGGTDKRIGIVAEEDVSALRAKVLETLESRSVDAFGDEVGPDLAIVPPTLNTGEPTLRFDAVAGDAATELSVTANIPATVLSYEPMVARSQARITLTPRLSEAAPTGFTLDPTTLSLSQPVEVAGASSSAVYLLQAEADARAVLSETERDNLAAALAGADPAEAEGLLRAVPAIGNFSISYEPGIWPDGMPDSANRITLDLAR
ncbi:MAG: baseplate J/gp47 family protein [Chloroflexota bacterium]|nr:baseplate J/gp47 family protein [Chloroflexota bacterium]